MRFAALILVMLLASPAQAVLAVVGYNVESGSDTDPALVAKDIEALGKIHIWGLSEVRNAKDLRVFRQAIKTAAAKAGEADPRYYYLLGTKGGGDRLAIVYDEKRFKHLDVRELEDEVGGSRPPLVAHLQDLGSGEEFLFMVNHLNRGNADTRKRQARGLNQWADGIKLPVIAVGDYNFDWDLDREQGNWAFALMTEDGPWHWVRPQCGVDGDWSDCPSTQCNKNYNSLLDFTFVAGEARNWSAETVILFPEDGYCQRERNGTADHRPVKTIFGSD